MIVTTNMANILGLVLRTTQLAFKIIRMCTFIRESIY